MCVGAKPNERCYRYMYTCIPYICSECVCVCKKMIGYNIMCVRAMGWVMKQSILDDEESCRAEGATLSSARVLGNGRRRRS